MTLRHDVSQRDIIPIENLKPSPETTKKKNATKTRGHKVTQSIVAITKLL